MTETSRKNWTDDEEELLKELYKTHSPESISVLMKRPVTSIYMKANRLKLQKYKLQDNTTHFKGYLFLVHEGSRVRTIKTDASSDISEAVASWFREIRPSLKRGEKVSLEFELDY